MSQRVSFEIKNLTPLLVQSVCFMLVVQDVSSQPLSQAAMPPAVMDSYPFRTIRQKNLFFCHGILQQQEKSNLHNEVHHSCFLQIKNL